MYEELEDLEEMELDGLLEDYENFEEFEDSEDYENFEAFEDLETFEAFEDMENFEEYENFEGYEAYEDLEVDQFIGKLIKKAGRAIKKVARGPLGKALKGLARTAATVAGGAIGGPAGAGLARTVAGGVIRESDMEGDYEAIEQEESFEADFESLGGDVEIYQEMEYLAALAAETDSQAEADLFIGALSNLVGPLIASLTGETGDLEIDDQGIYEDESDYFLSESVSPASSLPSKATPLVKKGIKAVGKTLASSPQSRKVLRALPTMTAKTGVSLARQAQAGKPVNRQRIASTMARHTASTIAKPQQLARAMQRNRQLALQRVQSKGTALRPARRTGAAGGRPATVRRPGPELVRRAVKPPANRVDAGIGVAARPVVATSIAPVSTGPMGGRRRRRRIIRPRYCVY